VPVTKPIFVGRTPWSAADPPVGLFGPPTALSAAFSRLPGILRIAVAVLLLQAGLSAQTASSDDLATGKLLVASRDLNDPNFAKTVVLLIHYDEEGVLGLIVNRQSTVPLFRVFPNLDEVKGRSDPMYAGGPVEQRAMLALIRSRSKSDESVPVVGDIRLISDKKLLEKTIAAGTDPSAFHVYVGYAGWTAKQLDGEVEAGAWLIFPGDAALVFDSRPESVWSRLIGKTEKRIAKLMPLRTEGSSYRP
jgi:putative AlgH/UPF0301 family transcriptional regulator